MSDQPPPKIQLTTPTSLSRQKNRTTGFLSHIMSSVKSESADLSIGRSASQVQNRKRWPVLLIGFLCIASGFVGRQTSSTSSILKARLAEESFSCPKSKIPPSTETLTSWKYPPGSCMNRPGYPPPDASYPHTGYSPKQRTEFRQSEITAACWPSTGGIWIKKIAPAELEFLGLTRFHETLRSEDPREEDAFCKKFRLLGPRFWTTDYRKLELRRKSWGCSMIDECFWPETSCQEVEIGRLNNGSAWIIDYERVEHDTLAHHGFYYAFDMEERAKVIRQLGGKFCYSYKDCIEIAHLVD